ncbi:MAG: hypothetical protein PVG63_01795 [Anaerolineales bacterium]|jgi:hypothetical protein
MADDFDIGGPLPEESTNRPFIIMASILGGSLLLSVICLVVYALVLRPGQQSGRETEVAQQNLENTQIAETATALVLQLTPSATITQATPSVTPTLEETPTQVVVLPTDTPFETLPTLAPQTATEAARQTLDAIQGTVTATATALPVTGFADDVGVPTLLLLGAILVAVMFIARTLRTRPVT